MFLCQKHEKAFCVVIDSKIYIMNLLLFNFINISYNVQKYRSLCPSLETGVDDERRLQFRLKICELK